MVNMSKDQLRVLAFIKNFSGAGCILGIALFFISFFASGYNQGHILSIAGITILYISMWIFGIGLFFVLVDNLCAKKHMLKKIDMVQGVSVNKINE
jgi:hypothetical protein